MAGDFRLPRNDRLNNWQISDMLDLRRAAGICCDSAPRRNTCSSIRTPPARPAASSRSTASSCSSPGGRRTWTSPCPARSIPIREYRQWLFAGFMQDDVRLTDRLSLNLGLRYEAVTVPTGGRRQDLQPAQCHRCRAHDWRPVARQPVAEEFRPAPGRGVGSGGLGPDLGAGGLRHLSRSDPARVLLFLRQPQPAVHDADVDRQPAVPERDRELRFGCLHSRATADGELRPADAVHHAIQRQRATRDHRRPRRDGRIRRLARPQPDSGWATPTSHRKPWSMASRPISPGPGAGTPISPACGSG